MTKVLRSLALVAFFGLFIGACSSPRSELEDEVDELFDKLIDHLEAYADADNVMDAEGTATWYEGDQVMMNPDVSMPTDRSMFIISLAEEIEEHFTYISLEFLRQDPDDFEAWGRTYQERYEARCAEVDTLLAKIEERYRSDPDDFEVSLISFGGGLRLSRDDRLLFVRGEKGYFIDKVLYVDFEDWIPAVMEQMEKLQ